ncbi:MAG: CBS domain-containing protein [Myxococcales bacterium]|nr:CBS domain-containing protein [Myxococcales bacterium]MCB9754659.1 CBS domain-containing protein [Myxococcales bacterium]
MPTLKHIKHYMTATPETIEHDLPLKDALQRMAELRAHHLPVVNAHDLVGILSTRDISLAESLAGKRYANMTVAEAMTPDPFTCGPEAHLDAVAREMYDHRYGSVVIVDRDHPRDVLGIFTVTDALRVLATLGDESAD